MERRDFLRNSALLGLAAGLELPIQSALADDTVAPPFQLNGAPVVGHTTPNESTILWAVKGPSTSWLEYGETPALGSTAYNDGDGLRDYDAMVHRINLRGLNPGTRYYYRAHTRAIAFKNAYDIKPGDELTSEIGSFTTLDPKADSTSFIVWNDTHDNRATLTALHELSKQIPHDFLMHDGDIGNDLDSEAQLVDLFVNPYGLPFAQNAPLFFTRGNHDVRGRAARHLPQYIAVPDDKFYFSFRQGPVAAIVLDTGEDKPDDHPVYGGLNNFAAYRSKQQEWLEAEIEKPEFRHAPFRLLFCHIPLWWKDASAGSSCADGRQKWHDLLTKAKIHAVISGHTHQTFVLPPTGEHAYYQIVGGGPQTPAATLMHGQATNKELKISIQDVTGKALNEVVFKA